MAYSENNRLEIVGGKEGEGIICNSCRPVLKKIKFCRKCGRVKRTHKQNVWS